LRQHVRDRAALIAAIATLALFGLVYFLANLSDRFGMKYATPVWVGGLSLISLTFGRVRQQKFYLPALIALFPVILMCVHAVLFVGWHGALLTCADEPLAPISPAIALALGYLSARAKPISRQFWR